VEATNPERDEARRAIRHGNRLHAAHLVLCAVFVAWRAAQATPGLSVDDGATWPTTALGRGVALVSALACVAALTVAVATTIAARRDKIAWVLLAALALALGARVRVDAFDLLYVALVLLASVWWYRERRPVLRERVLAG
jgi:hypothetical protein